ncbi:hypothetical protein BV25DRAFT_1532256 [Artomyces pyxidatus]|uniref:Uncharacterized protein n=1 Tax=Artomyces pyxidatus TaxID=48021 RepID=A0ACB8TCW1_9AGAM|nr:hypothetical protein BV25DRAFT_1532256 [Artomyces pyxidatus]
MASRRGKGYDFRIYRRSMGHIRRSVHVVRRRRRPSPTSTSKLLLGICGWAGRPRESMSRRVCMNKGGDLKDGHTTVAPSRDLVSRQHRYLRALCSRAQYGGLPVEAQGARPGRAYDAQSQSTLGTRWMKNASNGRTAGLCCARNKVGMRRTCEKASKRHVRENQGDSWRRQWEARR